MKQISITDTIKEGLEATNKNLKSVVLLFVAFDVLLSIVTNTLSLGILNLLVILETLFLQIAIFNSFQKPYSKFDIKQILNLEDPQTKSNLWKLFITFLITIILILLLSLLLVIPGIIFATYWFVVAFVVLDQDISGMAALKKSKELIKGHWWKTFGLFLIMIIAFILISQILTFSSTSVISQILYAGLNGLITVVMGYVTVAYYFKLKKFKS